MHPYLNSSNLVPLILKQPGQFRSKLSQFCCNCAIVRSEQQDILLQMYDMAGACQRGRRDLFIVPLQHALLLCFASKPVQFRAGVEI